MANNKTDKPSKSGPGKRPSTIDLKATEIRDGVRPEPADPEVTRPDAAKPEAIEPEVVVAEAVQAEAAEPQAPSPEPQVDARKPDPVEAKTEAHVKTEAPVQQRPNASPWSAIAAGVLLFAGGIGGGYWLSRELQPPPPPPAPVAALAPSQPAIPPELLDRLAKVEAALSVQRAPDPQLVARLAAAEAAVKTAAEMAAARERRHDETAALAREAKERASSAAATADEAAKKANAASAESSRAAVEALTGRLAALEETSRAHQSELAKRAAIPPHDRPGRQAVAALSLRGAVESGAPFTAELAALRTLSGDAKSFAALEPFAASGVPTAASLGRELSAAMPAIWKAARTDEPAGESFLERLSANAQKIVRIRPAGEQPGDDAPNVKARLELRAGNADIRGALAELAKLPPDARAPAEAWIKKAEARNAALAAAQSLAQAALAALAKSGS